ncbi:MAG: metallopeptidase family protein [Verrucomicrobia bacterium]|nr:metallopeptidase family protein [Verrucomicrobiota bacterium]
MPPIWNFLLKLAEAEVVDTLARLPAPLRSQAVSLPIRYEPQPNTHLLRDGIEPDTLGLFVGPDFAESGVTGELPSQIILFLENIWDAAEGDDEIYREEVQTTLLHELGHFLGLDEIDLEDRGLE